MGKYLDAFFVEYQIIFVTILQLVNSAFALWYYQWKFIGGFVPYANTVKQINNQVLIKISSQDKTNWNTHGVHIPSYNFFWRKK